MTEEKRRFSRIVFHVSARLETDEHRFDFDSIENLSVGGCLVEIPDAEAALKKGQPVIFKIFLEHFAPPVQVAGEIARLDGKDVSVKFTTIDPENLYHLQNIIRYNSKDTNQIEKELHDHPGLK